MLNVKFYIAVALVGMSLGLAGCHASVGTDTTQTYEMTENGCSTGTHQYSSHEDYCHKLTNDALNNYCAGFLRYQTLKADCQDVIDISTL